MSSSMERKEKGIFRSSNPSPTPKLEFQRRNNKIWVVIICFLIYRLTIQHFWHPADQFLYQDCPQGRCFNTWEEWRSLGRTECEDRISSFQTNRYRLAGWAVRSQWASPLKKYFLCWSNQGTESYDPVGVDPWYEIFASFHWERSFSCKSLADLIYILFLKSLHVTLDNGQYLWTLVWVERLRCIT